MQARFSNFELQQYSNNLHDLLALSARQVSTEWMGHLNGKPAFLLSEP